MSNIHRPTGWTNFVSGTKCGGRSLTYTDDVDLNAKLEAWESFYNYDRPHMSHDGQTPYEVMKSLLEI